MANRSYLFSTNFDKSSYAGKENREIRGISEFDYDIPLAYKILVSQDAKIVNSIIWEYSHPIAIQGDFSKGKRKFFDFLDALVTENILDGSIWEEKMNEARGFLNSAKCKNDFFLLENGEIYEMTGEALEAQNLFLFENEILKIDDTISRHLLRIKELKQGRQNKHGLFSGFGKSKKANNESDKELIILHDLLGIDYWSDVLYYNFS